MTDAGSVVARWSRADAIGPGDELAVDALGDTTALVLDGVSAADDAALAWCRAAPTVVIGIVPAGARSPANVDAVVDAGEVGVLDRLLTAVAAHPLAARTLVDVVRASAALPVASALVVESLAYSMLLAGPEFAAWLAERPHRPPRHFAADSLVGVVRTGDRVAIALTRPENRNAVGAAMRDALYEAFVNAAADPSVAAIELRGDGPCFSSGGDLDEFGTAPDVARAHHIRVRRSVGAAIARVAPRTTAVVHGACAGAGVELSAFAGRVVARRDTTFVLPEIEMGLIPGAGGTVSITRRIGPQALVRFALLGDPIGATTALALGLVDAVED